MIPVTPVSIERRPWRRETEKVIAEDRGWGYRERREKGRQRER